MRDIQTTLMGNAVADPSETKQADGSTGAKVRIAVTGRYFDPAKGDFSDRKSEFITVFARRALARNLLASVVKGQPLVVTGRLGTSEWKGEDQVTHHSLTLQAEAIGHDLTFGTSGFQRTRKAEDVPDVDPRTGEIVDRDEEADDAEERELTAAF